MIDIIIKWGIPFVLTGIIGYIVKQLKDNKENNHAMKDSMVLLLRSQIVSKCEKYLQLGYLPDYARSCLNDLFKQYEVLGGNHGVKILINKTFSLSPAKNDME